MKIIDQNGRLFGKISVIDLVVVAVIVVLAIALNFKSNQAHTGTSVPEETITFQIRVRGVRGYVANCIAIDDSLYDQNYSSGGRALGQIKDIQVERDPGTVISAMSDGTVILAEAEETVDLLLTVEGTGLRTGKSVAINRIYDLGVNSARTYYTQRAQFTGTVASIS